MYYSYLIATHFIVISSYDRELINVKRKTKPKMKNKINNNKKNSCIRYVL